MPIAFLAITWPVGYRSSVIHIERSNPLQNHPGAFASVRARALDSSCATWLNLNRQPADLSGKPWISRT
jgi:hypothetical protein